MTDYEISQLSSLTTPADDDLLVIVDTSDKSTPPAGSAGSDKKITFGDLTSGLAGGTVTSVTVESANGFAGTVADDTSTPEITVETTVTGLLKGNGTAVSAATAGTDYLAPSGSGAALTGITATQVGADTSGAAATAQSNAESFATSAVATETSRAETAEGLLLPLTGGTVSGALAVSGELTANGWNVPLLTPGRNIPYRAASSIATQFQTGHGWTASGAGVGSSNLNDTSIFIRGTQCATIVTAGNGSQAALSITGLTALNLTGKMLRITFQVSGNFANLANLGFYVGSGGSGFTDNFLWNIFTSTPGSLNYVQQGEWITVCISWADLYGASGYTISAAGAPSTKTGFTSLRLAVYDDDTSNAVTVHWQSVEIVPDTSATFPNGLVSFMFDDSYQNVYDNGRQVLDAYGYAASLMTIADQIGQSSRLTLTELRTLQNFSGWEVAGHAYTLANHNAGYETLTADQVNTDLRNLKSWLVSNGFHGESFAYPSGFFSPTTDNVPVDQIASQYFAAGRTIISELNEVWAPPMPLRIKALTGISSEAGGVPVSTIVATGGVLERCAQQGAWLIFVLHQIVTSGVSSTTQLLQSDLQTLVAAVNSYGMTVLPMSAVTRFYG